MNLRDIFGPRTREERNRLLAAAAGNTAAERMARGLEGHVHARLAASFAFMVDPSLRGTEPGDTRPPRPVDEPQAFDRFHVAIRRIGDDFVWSDRQQKFLPPTAARAEFAVFDSIDLASLHGRFYVGKTHGLWQVDPGACL
ncbi:MAG TPA: hypothetical protein VHZ73_08385 [Vicinamibacterales bacterium]|jgi:hypothetical protein|nr:hypothetical protein [Vicinamibacterales bacterium]